MTTHMPLKNYALKAATKYLLNLQPDAAKEVLDLWYSEPMYLLQE